MKTDEISLIESTFELLVNHQETLSQSVYDKLFHEYPDMQQLFKRVTIEQQSRKLFYALTMIVQNISYPNLLRFSLRELGKRHAKHYGVVSEHYPIFKTVFLEVIAAALDEHWTPDVAAAWNSAFDEVIEIMLSD